DAVERSLEKIVTSAGDLGSSSFELERSITGWASEYHLSRKRAQLLCGFDFAREQRVLEIGSGCGAITRFLGETFAHVVAVEGSARRARIARARTRDLEHVDVVCAPFQDLHFERKFDLVIVVGVLEYAAKFGSGSGDPYDAFLRRCRACLTDTGVLVLAIENQFGLKYFAGIGEDHSGTPFDGLEGYATRRSPARTFGRHELEARCRKQFERVEFHYPFPDYKIPSAVLSEAALATLDVTGLVSAYPARDYLHARRKPIFDDALVWAELARNRMSPLFSPSFLVVAGQTGSKLPSLGGLGVVYSANRKPELQTVTRIVRDASGDVRTIKSRRQGVRGATVGPLTLRAIEEPWVEGASLSMLLHQRSREGRSLLETFAPSKPWFEWLEDASRSSGHPGMVDGRHLDAVWRNAFLVDGRCVFIDQEWAWNAPLKRELLVIRSLHDFFQGRGGASAGKIAEIAAAFGVRLSAPDFDAFVDFEAHLRELVFDQERDRMRRGLAFELEHPYVYARLRDVKRLARSLRRR
ncbi:MAG: hypothetical protein JWM74_6236, partial [Myxococcaceae bacterium]|nr:hypothetical protein [Myxococcaceae bacterium]